MDGREGFRDRLGRGADTGPGPILDRPTIFMSSGWKRPRRTLFFIWNMIYEVFS